MAGVISPEKVYTIAEFAQIAEGNDKFYELVEGRIVVMSPTQRRHGKVEGNLYGELWLYNRENSLGGLHPSDTGFVIDPIMGTVRAPDIGFITAERAAEIDSDDGFIPFPPDLAVEVRSPNDKTKDVQTKLTEYRQAEVRLIWLIDPVKKQVEVYRRGQDTPTLLTINDELDGEDVLPGFKLQLKALFK